VCEATKHAVVALSNIRKPFVIFGQIDIHVPTQTYLNITANAYENIYYSISMERGAWDPSVIDRLHQLPVITGCLTHLPHVTI
jgi:hypothetical protein